MTALAAPNAAPAALPVRTEPWPHQIDAFHFARDRRAAMLAIGMGGGKGLCAIALAEHHHAQRILVCCPKSVVGVWPAQLAEHAQRDWSVWHGQVNGARGTLRNPSVARRAEALQAELRASSIARRPMAAVINYEACAQGAMREALYDIDWDLVILDESHRIKAPGGVQSRYLARLCTKVRHNGGRILALTGTPMPHTPLDLYGQYRAIDPTILGTSNAAFKARYAGRKIYRLAREGEAIRLTDADNRALHVVGKKPNLTAPVIRLAEKNEPIYAVGPRMEPLFDGIAEARRDELAERVGRIMFRVDQERLDRDLGLAEPVDVHRTTDLSTEARRVYDTLERDGIAEVADGVVTAANAMVLVLRLAQATSGFARDADTHHERPLGDGLPDKARLLDDVLTDLDTREPVVVFARFHRDLDAIQAVCAKQGRRYGELSGRRRDGLTSDSKMSTEIDVLGAQLKSGGVGIDLTRARYGLYYSQDFALADYLQSRKRLHRPGQARRVTYIHLLAANTVDETIHGALRRREDVIRAFLAHLDTKGKTP